MTVACLSLILLLLITKPTTADYQCLCNYHIENPVYPTANNNGAHIGSLAEFDCRPLYLLITSTSRWQAIQYQNQVGYVALDTNSKVQTCPGQPSADDLVIATTTVKTPKINTRSAISSSPSQTSTTTGKTTSRVTTTKPPLITAKATSTTRISTTTGQTSSKFTSTKPALITSTSTSTTKTSTTIGKSSSRVTTTKPPYITSTAASATQTTSRITPTKPPLITSTATSTTQSSPTTTNSTAVFITSFTTAHIASTTTPSTHTVTSRAVTTPTRATTMLKTSTTTKPITFRQTTMLTTPPSTLPSTSSTTLPTTTTATTTRAPQCPPQVRGYHKVYEHSCYEFIMNIHRKWPDAEHNCNNKGGHLISIGSMAEQNFIYNTLRSTHRDHEVWTGLTDQDSEGHWKWSSGERTTFRFWDSGEPSSAFLGINLEDCAMIKMDKGGRWGDISCTGILFSTEKHGYICEYRTI